MPDIAMQSKDSNVQKIVIQAFKDKKLESQQVASRTFTVPINPETLSQKFEIKLEQSQGTGNQGNSGKYTATLPEELKLDFQLDGTKTVSGNAMGDKTVTEQVRELLDTVYLMNGDSHKPNFLKIVWNKHELFGPNKTAFDCQLKTLDIQYVLFSREGAPLRAKVSAVFSAYVADQKRVIQQDQRSPDLTHVRTVTPGDRLWLMTHRTYDNTDPLLQVALANGLTTFRHLEPSEEIILPPYDRTET